MIMIVQLSNKLSKFLLHTCIKYQRDVHRKFMRNVFKHWKHYTLYAGKETFFLHEQDPRMTVHMTILFEENKKCFKCTEIGKRLLYFTNVHQK